VTLAPDGVVSTLWNLTFNQQHLRCVVYRSVNGMELRLESPAGVILTEPFDMEPRALAKTKALGIASAPVVVYRLPRYSRRASWLWGAP
jgi:hypothetical protein